MSSDVTPPGTAVPSSGRANRIPIRLWSREILAALAWTLAADVLIFRMATYLSMALFLVLVPVLYRYAASTSPHRRAMAVCGGLSAMVAWRLVWLGSPLAVAAAVTLIVAMSMAASGVMPFVLEGLVWSARSLFDGAGRISRYRWTAGAINSVRAHHHIAAVVLPAVAVTVFGGLFVMANPDLVNWVAERMDQWANRIWVWMAGFSVWELPFCVLALLVGIGLIRPAMPSLRLGGETREPVAMPPSRSSLYDAYRNTLVAVTGLFALYLGFEFWTLWRRDFPQGFYYAGYAHQGAAWLTIALGLATVALSVIFGRSLLSDPRLPRVRWWAWIWSAENLLLALAVYNRLLIYIGYNGLTRMRWVGLFGITAVVLGFGLVVYKISHSRDFWWLLRSQMLAVVVVMIVYSVTPIDYLAHRYNVAKVQNGQSEPSVMLAVKPVDDEGLLAVFSLLDHSDEIIREGVAARLAIRQGELEAAAPRHWSELQLATRVLQRRLEQHPEIAASFRDPSDRRETLDRFVDYAMQWY